MMISPAEAEQLSDNTEINALTEKKHRQLGELNAAGLPSRPISNCFATNQTLLELTARPHC
jgi:hypothetical protein